MSETFEKTQVSDFSWKKFIKTILKLGKRIYSISPPVEVLYLLTGPIQMDFYDLPPVKCRNSGAEIALEIHI